MTSLLDDAFAHHVWATERLIDACATLTREQLVASTPGTYGPILATLAHLVVERRLVSLVLPRAARADRRGVERDASPTCGRPSRPTASAWRDILAGDPDPEADLVERGDGWEFHQPAGLRLAQAIHHGTDHRSQVCTALTSLGIEPPEIDLWAYGEATGRTRAIEG